MRANDIEKLVSVGRPAIAPDASFAVFATSRPDLAANKAVGQLWRIDLPGGGTVNLTCQRANAQTLGVFVDDTVRVNKQTLMPRDTIVGEKAFRIVVDPGGGTRELPVAESDRTRLCLSEKQLEAVCALALRLERHFDKPQDVEFALVKEEAFVLQSRPITAAVHRRWQEHFHRPFAVVAGQRWLAGNVSLYAPGRPTAYPSEDDEGLDLSPQAAPWVRDPTFRRDGGVVIWDADRLGPQLPGPLRERRIQALHGTALAQPVALEYGESHGGCALQQLARNTGAANCIELRRLRRLPTSFGARYKNPQ